MLDSLDADAIRRWCAIGLAALRRHQREIDELNVFPVPDGDTGTNLVLTFTAAQEQLAGTDAADLRDTMFAFARGALLGARGNSGVIISQLLAGLAGAFEVTTVNGRTLASGLSDAADSAYRAVAEPVEGTILSVARGAARAAAVIDTDELARVAKAAAAGAAEALARTPDQLPALARAGVVDAGGRGLVVLLDALVEVITGQAAASPPPASAPYDQDRSVVRETGSPEFAFEVQFLLDAPAPAVDALAPTLATLGDSLVVVGAGLAGAVDAAGVPVPTWNVHVHVNDVGAALEAAVNAGRPHRISVTHFAEQIGQRSAEQISQRSAEQISQRSAEQISKRSAEQISQRSAEQISQRSAEQISKRSAEPGQRSAERISKRVAEPSQRVAEPSQRVAEPSQRDAGQGQSDAEQDLNSGQVSPRHAAYASERDGGPTHETELLGRPDSPVETFEPAVIAPSVTDRPKTLRATVVVATGAGLAALFEAEGAAVVAGPNPSTAEILAVVRGTGASRVVILPDAPSTQGTAGVAAAEARDQGIRVSIVPTRSPVQALAALAVRDAGRRFEDDVIAMAEAAGACRYAEVTHASREALTVAGRCQPGDVLALVDGEVNLIGSDLAGTCRDLLDRLLAAGGELVTLLTGADASDDLADDLRAYLAANWPFVEAQAYAGGQPNYPLLVGIE